MNLYIAAAGSERGFIAKLKSELGRVSPDIQIVSHWDVRYTKVAELLGDHANQKLSFEDRKRIFEANMREMRLAHGFVVLTHRGRPRDTYAELGWAVAANRLTLLIERPRHRSTFGAAPNVTTCMPERAGARQLARIIIDFFLVPFA